MRSSVVIAFLLVSSCVVEAKRQLVRDVKTSREMNKIMAHHTLTGLPIVIDYYSDSCGPCRMMEPVYKQMAKEYENRAVFLKVNTQFAYELSAGVRSLPTFRFYMGGKKVNEFAGAGEGQLRQIVQDLARQARQRTNHIFEAKDKKKFQYYLETAATLPVVVSYVTKNSDGCVKVWPEIKKLAQSSFGRAIFIKIDTEASKELAEENEIRQTPTFQFYRIKQKHAEEVTDADGAKVKKILNELLLQKVDDAKGAGAAKCPDIPPQPKTPKPKRPNTRSPYRKKANRAEKVVILGAGPAGLSAAVYAARAGLKPLVIAPDFGGQLMFTKDVENYPAVFSETGPKLLDSMRAQAEQFETQFEAVTALAVDLTVRPFQIKINRTEDNLVYALSIIVSTGADARWLGAPGEKDYQTKGISTCATCDGYLFKGQNVVVIGGGDTAMEEALYLARICSKVTIIHRRDSFRASHYLRERVLNNPQISVKWNSSVVRFEGKNDALTTVVISTVKDGATAEEALEVGAAFIAIGHIPNTAIFKGQLGMDSEGYITLPHGRSTATTVPGVFACGDVADNVYRQAVTSAGTGAMAALDVERYMNEHDIQDPPVQPQDYSTWTVKELKDAMKELGVSAKGCVEKKDFIDRLTGHQQETNAQ